ncbi:MAG: tripartite tricarboxylate transporter substrate-binding protein [Rhodospirillaceae bacterium]
MAFKALGTVVTAAAVAGALAVAAKPTHAEYPNDKVLLNIVPFGAGGGTDRWARVFASSGFDFFENGMRIQNRGGASGTIGWKHMLETKPDGYTVIMASPTPVMAALAEKKKAPFDPANVKIVCYYSVMKSTLMAPKGSAWETWDKLLASLKTAEKKVTIGGTMTQVLGAVQALKQLGLQDKVIPVVYSGTGKAMNDYIGRHIDLIALTTSTAITMTDKHNAIFNASDLEYPKKAMAVLGDVPNAKKLGLKAYNPPRFFAMHPDTPDAQVAAMSDAIGKLLKHKPVVNLLGKLGEVIDYVPHDQAKDAYKEILTVAKDNIVYFK